MATKIKRVYSQTQGSLTPVVSTLIHFQIMHVSIFKIHLSNFSGSTRADNKLFTNQTYDLLKLCC